MDFKINKKLTIVIILIILIVVLIVKDFRKNKNISVQENAEISNSSNIKVELDNSTEKYTIYSENNEIIQTNADESSIKFYQDNPDYRPNSIELLEE